MFRECGINDSAIFQIPVDKFSLGMDRPAVTLL
jgi:hypothetical protein